jgi:hypothetical protein
VSSYGRRTDAVAKKKTQPGYAICGQCAEAIDLKALNLAIAEDRPYVHYCGRVLHWGGNESEVRPSDPDDAVSDITSPSDG